MKDYRLAYITAGHSEYDDEIREMLSKNHPYQRCFTEFDHLDLADCFILAGADIKTRTKDDEVQVEIFIDPEGKSDFVKRLDRLIAEKYACFRGRRNFDLGDEEVGEHDVLLLVK